MRIVRTFLLTLSLVAAALVAPLSATAAEPPAGPTTYLPQCGSTYGSAPGDAPCISHDFVTSDGSDDSVRVDPVGTDGATRWTVLPERDCATHDYLRPCEYKENKAWQLRSSFLVQRGKNPRQP